LLIEEIEGRLFWDADYDAADTFLDLPPDAAASLSGRFGRPCHSSTIF
jgi:hypothetical protein